MSVSEPVPPVPEPVGPYGPTWAPPAWDRPSEGVVPVIVPVNAVLGKGEAAALVLQSLRVSPTGVVLDVGIMRNPRQRLAPAHAGFVQRAAAAEAVPSQHELLALSAAFHRATSGVRRVARHRTRRDGVELDGAAIQAAAREAVTIWD